MLCCEPEDQGKTDCGRYKDFKDEAEITQVNIFAVEELVKRAMTPLLEEINRLKNEVKDLKESNIELIQILTKRNGNTSAGALKTVNNETETICNNYKSVYQKPAYVGVISIQNQQQTLQNIHRDKNGESDKRLNLMSSGGEDVNVRTSDSEWKIHTNRRKRRSQGTIIGKANLSSTDVNFAAAQTDKKAWLYIGRVQNNIEPKIVKNYLIKEIPEAESNLVLEKLNTKGTNLSFKLGINFKFKDDIFHENFWPNGIIVRRFNFRVGDFLEKRNLLPKTTMSQF